MKKCPFCGAEIEENARFCLYCMTPLEEKQVIDPPKTTHKRWLYAVAAVLLLAALVCGAVWKTAGKADADRPTDPETESTSHTDTGTTENDPTQTTSVGLGSTTRFPTTAGAASVGNAGTASVGSADSAKPSVSNHAAALPATGSSSVRVTVTTTGQAARTTQATSGTPVAVTYTYREGTVADCYPAGQQPVQSPQDVIVITGVNTVSPSGVYDIPETIDGKRVAAIMPSAFCASNISATVKSVYLPAGVRMVWDNAFGNCYNLTDMYVRSPAIGIEETAFPAKASRTGTLTIHCAADCRNLDYYYYRNIADRYDARYEEWNG